MLGKILKYEFKASARLFLLMYAALLALAAIGAILSLVGGSFQTSFTGSLGTNVYSVVSGITILLYVLGATAMIVVTIVVIVMRFYKMLGSEGYLWFALPASANQQILGKLISAFAWTVASCIVIVASIGLLTVGADYSALAKQFSDSWNTAISQGFNPSVWLLWAAILMLFSWLNGILMFYAAMAMGPNMIKSRLGGSVLAYFILYIAAQVFGLIVLLALAVPISMQAQSIGISLPATVGVNDLSSVAPALDQLVETVAGVFSGMEIIPAAVFYFLTHRFLSRKLNLA
ncbi:MAG: hypothetical protein FWD72_02940 [Eggerthellaceae bacterium]|nr:hypothetical protein [Eggerthellaceae bacterium]